MDRFAKGVRVAGGLLLFVNLAAFFLPVTQIEQENYETIRLSPLQYVKEAFCGDYDDINQMLVIFLLMALPVLLSLVAGIIGVVGSPKQLVSGILSLLIVGAYIALLFQIELVWQPSELQTCSWDYAMFIHVGVSGAAAVFGILSFCVRPRIRKANTSSVIPQLYEIRQEQENARYNIVEPMTGGGDPNLNIDIDAEAAPVPDSSSPRGVMVGLAGMYTGAEILFQNGETIKLGRMPDNDLVLVNQPRVSRNHCVITWRDGRYEIVDYSSNGSFINGQDECLPQNIKIILQPGTILDVGSSENRFRLE